MVQFESSSFRVIVWPPFSSDFRLTTRALHWDRGRPARFEHRKVQGSRTSDVLFALRAHCRRDACGPCEELEWSSAGDLLKGYG